MQDGLDDNYIRLRNSLLNQVGRRIGDSSTIQKQDLSTKTPDAIPIDIGVFKNLKQAFQMDLDLNGKGTRTDKNYTIGTGKVAEERKGAAKETQHEETQDGGRSIGIPKDATDVERPSIW